MFTSFPGPASRSSPSTIAFDGPRPGPGILRDALGNVVDDWPDDQPIPDGWRITRSVALIDHATVSSDAAAAAPLSIDEAFAILPRRFTSGRYRLEGELSSEDGDNFSRIQALNHLRLLVRELEGLCDPGRPLPWDANSNDATLVRSAANACASYLRGWATPH